MNKCKNVYNCYAHIVRNKEYCESYILSSGKFLNNFGILYLDCELGQGGYNDIGHSEITDVYCDLFVYGKKSIIEQSHKRARSIVSKKNIV